MIAVDEAQLHAVAGRAAIELDRDQRATGEDVVLPLDRAAGANVLINALDARGLYAGNADASLGPNATVSDAFGPAAGDRLAAMEASENVMAELANGTGGTFFHNSNDLVNGLKSLAAPPQYLYLLQVWCIQVRVWARIFWPTGDPCPTLSIDNTWIVEWTWQETTAMLEHGKAIEIYDVSLGKGAISLETPPLLVAPCRAHSE